MTKILMTYEFENTDDVRAHLALMSRTDTAVISTVVPTLAAVAPAEEPAGETVARDSLDGDGMPYDAAVHSDPPSFSNDGLWRAKRGAKEAANQARAAFKAKGGAVVPPAPVLAAPVVAAPVLAAPTAPELPASAPAPVSLDTLFGKISELAGAGTLTGDALKAIYQKHCGTIDNVIVGQLLSTNESMRAAMFAELTAA